MIDKLKEKYLLFKAAKGSPEAIGEIFDRYHQKIYRFIYFRVSSKEEAEDIASDVFLQFQNHLNRDGKVESTSGLLYRIARNKIIDWYRSRKTEHVPLHNLETGEEMNTLERALADDSEERASQAIDIRVVLQKLDGLRDEYKEVILLHYINEMSVREIGQALEKTENNVRVLLFRALTSLRESLASDASHSEEHTNHDEQQNSHKNFKESSPT